MQPDLKTVVVLIALPEEYKLFQSAFPSESDLSTETQVRLQHASGRDDVKLISVLAQDMGSQSALLSTDETIGDLSPDLVIVLGIAGGVSSDLSVGDVCVSNEIIDVLHNAKVVDKGDALDIALAPDFYGIDAELVSSFTFLKVHPGLADSYVRWREAGRERDEAVALGDAVNVEGPELFIGPIACGPVVASDAFNVKLKALHRKVVAIETESGGVFGRLMKVKTPAIAIRGISDLADGDKAELERRSKGGARRIALLNAAEMLREQLSNDRFLNVALRHRAKSSDETQLFPREEAKATIISELDDEIRVRLAERSPEFKAKPESFYLPIPRARKINYADELAGKELDQPENMIDCLRNEKRVLIRLPRSYPSQALGWSLAHSLIRQQIEDRVVLPYVIQGEALNPPKTGIAAALPALFVNTKNRDEFRRVLIIEEPLFHARNRMRFLADELKTVEDYVLVLTKAEDNVSAVDDFVKDNGFKEYEIAPVSFSETAFFLEKAFAMTAREAEAVAIRLDDTFRKFRLEAHPTYFAGIQEDTLAALINANKRGELIQLAVDALLTLMVAADNSKPPLSRTTRERFLKVLVMDMVENGDIVDDHRLLKLAADFLQDGLLPTPAPDFLRPFFDIGLLYRLGDTIYVTHPYLESYLIAQALRDTPDVALTYFDPRQQTFNYYAFDLYCELGPARSVVDRVLEFSREALEVAKSRYPNAHAYLDGEQKLTALSSPRQLTSLTDGLMATAERMGSETDEPGEEVRSEKQRLLDARTYVRREVGQRNPAKQKDLPSNVREEFDTLDALSRALSVCTTAIGSGSESLGGSEKVELARLVLSLASRFSDLWTRNRLRVDFGGIRNDVLDDDNIWKLVEQLGADETDFEQIKSDVSMMIHSFELNTILEPMGRVLAKVSSTAGVAVLAPVLDRIHSDDQIESLIRSTWMLDVSPEKGRDALKVALASYSGTPLMRIVMSSHLLARVFWHHYKTAGARHFVNSVRRALRPLKLQPSKERLEQVRDGPKY